jgi:hypothetical protein
MVTGCIDPLGTIRRLVHLSDNAVTATTTSKSDMRAHADLIAADGNSG